MVQWLRLHASLQGARVRFLVGELRSHMPPGAAKIKEERKNKNKNILFKFSVFSPEVFLNFFKFLFFIGV